MSHSEPNASGTSLAGLVSAHLPLGPDPRDLPIARAVHLRRSTLHPGGFPANAIGSNDRDGIVITDANTVGLPHHGHQLADTPAKARPASTSLQRTVGHGNASTGEATNA
jgi:hypothetical protein